ncbi:MAG TPA: ABC-type transport auxiliary lipoprotein family protein [Planctomycetota bacterium]|nr:ABC-type transport auxiliary lipoprotein family protein [Planctomycetota bacterium]
MIDRIAAALGRVLLACAAACGAVEVPSPRTWRLAEIEGLRIERAAPHVVRVQDLRLAAHLSPDHLMVADGPLLLRAHELEQWAGPLDRMLTDVVISALRRAGAFADVKAGHDVGREDLWLSGTITDFCCAATPGGGKARVGLFLQLRRASDHALLLGRELKVETPLAERGAAAAVAGLGVALRTALAEWLARCADLPDDLVLPLERVPSGLAAPPGGR